MKKNFLVVSLILFSVFFVGCGQTSEPSSEKNEKFSTPSVQQEKVKADALSQAKSETALGSCFNSEDSTCTEFFGSFWSETNMRLSCDGTRVFSLEACPSGAAGGCEIGFGQEADAITWLYLSDTVTADTLKFSKMACESSGVGRWYEGR